MTTTQTLQAVINGHSMQLGYNTNGLAHHELLTAIELLAELGYEAIAITLDHHALNPFDERLPVQLADVGELLRARHMAVVIETGARYLLDARQKHEPTLVSSDPRGRQRRLEFLQRAVDIAVELNAQCVSLWSGVVRDGAGEGEAWDRLVKGLRSLVLYADARQMPLGFEPEPGMLVDSMAGYRELLDRLRHAGASDSLKLTLDIGHLHCLGEVPIGAEIRQWTDRLVNVHLEDMRRGVHEHLMFGEGEIDFPPVIAALAEIGYRGPVNVELSRHSHMGPVAAKLAVDFVRPLIERETSRGSQT